MKHIVLMYKDKANADSRIKELYESLLTGAKELDTKISVLIVHDTYYDNIRISISDGKGFNIRHIDGAYEVGRNKKADTLAEAYRLCANKIGALIYGSNDRDFY